MKEILIILNTFDLNHPVTRKTIEYLKKTDLFKTELFIADSGYENDEPYSKRIKAYMAYADGRPVVIIKSGVLVKDNDWLEKLINTSEASGASIVGCVGISENTRNKIYGYTLTDKAAHITIEDDGRDVLYVPAVTPGLVYIPRPEEIEIDEHFYGNMYVTDICVRAWSQGKKTAVSQALLSYGDSLLSESSLNEADIEHLRNKWCYYIKARLFLNEDIKTFCVS
ncbi:MAG: hypothetical protein H7844_07885 [Nitrospirae bacterium YQR-1]